jgi:peroxiredoxin
MRKIIVLIGFLGIVACNRTDRITIKGKLSDSRKESLYLEEMNLLNVKKIDSLRIKRNGRFNFHVKTRQPKFYQLKLSNNQYVNLLLNPGDKVRIYGDGQDLLNSARIEGSDESFRILELNKRLVSTIKKLDSITTVYESYADKAGNDSLLSELNKKYVKTLDQHRQYTIEFILQDQGSLANIMALYQEIKPGTYLLNRIRDLQFFKIVTDSLKKNYPNLAPVKVLEDDFKKRFAQYQGQKILKMAKGVNYGLPSVTLPNLNGDSVSLSTLKGKYVLLSFWASWDANSVRQNLLLKDVYKVYHKKGFEIYQVSFDKSYDNWKKEVHFDQLPWINVCDSTYPASRVAQGYNVQAIPTNYLINKQQDDILGKNLTVDELQQKLAGLYN